MGNFMPVLCNAEGFKWLQAGTKLKGVWGHEPPPNLENFAVIQQGNL